MTDSIKNKWEDYYSSDVIGQTDSRLPAEVLLNNQHLLPKSGKALDLACGLGANALCLAENHLTTSAWDISLSALEILALRAKSRNLKITVENRDVSASPPEVDSFDVIVVSRFLDRDLIIPIKNAIKSNGLVFYQTFTKEKVKQSGPRNPDYLLDENELLHLFKDWKILLYREEGLTGNTNLGFRNQAMLVAQNS